jgi:SAM-dependent methyltransferase
MPHTHAAHTDRHDDQPGWSDAAAADLLDLDGAVLRAYWTDVLAWVRRVAGTTGRLRVLDLGAGTGTGAIGLAETGADVEVVAVDSSAVALERIRAKALALGIADRVSTIEADLDQGWPADLVDLDLTWASMSLHHLADPDHVLRDIHTATVPAAWSRWPSSASARASCPTSSATGSSSDSTTR